MTNVIFLLKEPSQFRIICFLEQVKVNILGISKLCWGIMRKFVVTIVLLILILGVVSFLIGEARLVEEIIDEWNPIKPDTLFPY